MIPMALSMAPWHSSGKENLNEVQHDFFWSCDAIGTAVSIT